jgi:2-keto-4-pentenoate hydratase/2-oxohepta-3-ene-1,7-dioic acid hydratase in catechol pathway
MRIVRFEDSSGKVQCGEEVDAGMARPLRGDLYAGPKSAGDPVEIARLLAPVVPSNIYCIGRNYHDHAAEGGNPIPELPLVFMKPTSTICNPEQPILIPRVCDDETDFECELVVVIGKSAKNVPENDALNYVLGYTAGNDVSARKWQTDEALCGTQWIRGKGFDTFAPIGPALVTVDDIPDPDNLDLSTTLNGQVMQSHNTRDMIFSVRRLISFLSEDTTLQPGTLIFTGTPQGVGYHRDPRVLLNPGDQVIVEVEKIGRLVNPVEAAP